MAAAWVAGNVGVFGITFGLGHAVLGRPVAGAALVLLGIAALVLTTGALGRIRMHGRTAGER